MTTAAAPITLRNYQQRCVDGVREMMRDGKRRVLLVAPTGSGKRILAAWWAIACAERQRDMLFATDRTLLVTQMGEELAGQNLPFGIIMGDWNHESHHRVQLATIQSLDSRFLSGDPAGLPPANLLIIDEGHKAIESYMGLLKHYPGFAIILTATPVGPKGVTLIQPGYADVLFEGVKNSELIADGFLLPTKVFAPSEPNIKGVKMHNGEYAQGPLGKRVAQVTCFANLWDEWTPFADRQTIVFAPSIDYAVGLVKHPSGGDCFEARGIAAKAVSSRLKPKERDAIIQEFRDGTLRVLVSVDMLREGFDVPAASCAIDLQPCAQLRTYWQKIGRVKRPHENQEYAVYIDMAGNSWKFPHPDDDPTWPTGEESTQDVLEREFEAGSRQRTIRCPRCGAVYKPAPRCPDCKHEARASEIVKVIRMGNGKLREVKVSELRKKAKTAEQIRSDNWKAMLFRGLHAGLTLKQCVGIFKGKYGGLPYGLPCVPERGSASWNMRVNQVYSAGDIMKGFDQ